MEVALGSAALVGAGLVWNRITSSNTQEVAAVQEKSFSSAITHPTASNNRADQFAKANGRHSMTQMDVNQVISLSGRRDHTSFVDSPSPYEQQMARVYKPREGTKREVEATLDPSTRQDNIYVRSNTNYQDKFYSELQKPNRMHNVNPIATTTGTASQLVGPGVGAGFQAETGNQGLHYGQLRMRPAITEPTFREQKGSIIPGKSAIDNRTSEITLMRHAAANFGLGVSGFEKSEETNPEPLNV